MHLRYLRLTGGLPLLGPARFWLGSATSRRTSIASRPLMRGPCDEGDLGAGPHIEDPSSLAVGRADVANRHGALDGRSGSGDENPEVSHVGLEVPLVAVSEPGIEPNHSGTRSNSSRAVQDVILATRASQGEWVRARP